ncbi:putative adenosine deaminase [Mycobacterium xenopi 4042]|uniref:Putative adenosine deaminase n=1 Tax=Mycobacterium xenopi 4042 TaxID=1299334 RepID=X7YIB5_MYCXE|nr:putative adenosine deaminase [Mycobacterium xenopi 4042]
MTTPLTLDMISKAPKALLHDHLDGGCARLLCSTSRPDRLRRPALHRRRRAGPLVSHPLLQRVAGALPRAVCAHRRGDADT